MRSESVFRGRIRVVYPLDEGRIVLRTEQDWDRDLEPVVVEAGRQFDFEVTFERPVLYFKSCMLRGDRRHWETGPNQLAVLAGDEPQRFHPTYVAEPPGLITDLIELESSILDRDNKLRVYLPPGYGENYLKHYPVVYMQDGANVFFPDDAFLGQDWHVNQAIELMLRMTLIEPTLVVGVYAGEDRHAEYTRPGYERYGRALVEEVRPLVDEKFRTKTGPEHTLAMGSSLGGVAAFYLGWEWPEVFGRIASMSGTFDYRDDLIERVRHDDIESRRALRIYLDSGWPQDNYEATLAMATALSARGFELGRDLIHFAFPLAGHNERSWAERCHLPLQMFSGRLRRAAERQRSLRNGSRGA